MNFLKQHRDNRIWKCLDKALDCLSVDDRFLLHLYYGEGLTVEEIAEELDETKHSVKDSLKRARFELLIWAGVRGKWLDGSNFDEVAARVWQRRPAEEKIEKDTDEEWERINKELENYDPQFVSLSRNRKQDGDGLRDLQILAVIDVLGGKAGLDKIHPIVDEWSSANIEKRFVQAALVRLQDRLLTTAHVSDGMPDGRKPERIFKMTAAGRSKLSGAPRQALARVKGEEWDESDNSAWRSPL